MSSKLKIFIHTFLSIILSLFFNIKFFTTAHKITNEDVTPIRHKNLFIEGRLIVREATVLLFGETFRKLYGVEMTICSWLRPPLWTAEGVTEPAQEKCHQKCFEALYPNIYLPRIFLLTLNEGHVFGYVSPLSQHQRNFRTCELDLVIFICFVDLRPLCVVAWEKYYKGNLCRNTMFYEEFRCTSLKKMEY